MATGIRPRRRSGHAGQEGERSNRSTEAIRLLQGSLLLVSAIAVPLISIRLTDPTKASVLKGFAVVVLSFLPGWLFLRFVVVRARSVWDEYVLNLHRLGMDRVEYLPEPPQCSLYYEQWKAAGGAEHAKDVSIYRQKFEAYYGKGTARGADDDNRRFRAETFFPVALATIVFSVGWLVVVNRPSIQAFEPELPGDALCFAFMGAYLFTLQMLLRRYFQADLKAGAYVSAVVRIVTALALVLAVMHLLRGSEPPTQLVVAFVVGFFPLVGLQALQKAAALVLRTVVPTLKNSYPLSDLDGLSVWYESRLLELGIEDMQNLATANLVDVILHSRVPVGRLVDWVDQAILYLHLEPQPHGRKDTGTSSRMKLRRLGIRTATSLEEAFRPHPDDAHPFIPSACDNDLVAALRWALNDTPDEKGPSVSQALLKTFATDGNLKHIRHWKTDWREPSPPRPGRALEVAA